MRGGVRGRRRERSQIPGLSPGNLGFFLSDWEMKKGNAGKVNDILYCIYKRRKKKGTTLLSSAMRGKKKKRKRGSPEQQG